jgi:DNA-binding GntR family transcriptional regulator
MPIDPRALAFGAMAPSSRLSMTKTDAAFHALRQSIESGALKPGEHVRISTLLRDLGMSPTPIREALRLLQAEGLVEYEPHKGVVVASYAPADLDEIYSLRGVLEPLATERAAQLATGEELDRIRAAHEELVAAAQARRIDAAHLNAQWHWAVYEASHSGYLREFIRRLWSAIPVQAVWVSTRSAESLHEHTEIVRALERRDAEEAGRLMRAHIRSAWEAHSLRLDRESPQSQ